jgi:hypothetical protein
MYSNTVRTLGTAALLSLLPGIALAAQPEGMWNGLIRQANANAPAVFRFVPKAANAQFGEPFSCNVTAKLLKEDGATTVYRFMASINGGRFCDSVYGRDLTVTPMADGRLQIVFDAGKVTWNGELRKHRTATP